MTLSELDRIYAATDKAVADSLSDAKENPPCCKGCFYCCKEPAYASSEEIKGVLSLLTTDQINDLRIKVSLWRDLFLESGLDKTDDVKVGPYRTLNLWCPLLNVDGSCSVYARRPVCCRVHVAKSNPEKCADEDLRLHQIFIYFEGIGMKINHSFMDKLIRDGDRLVYDHIGLLLYEALFGVETITASRIEIELKGDDLIIKTREPEKVRELIKQVNDT